MSTEIINTESNECECPICFDVIENNKDKIITKCNHTFHASCLMTNVAHNGFGCPYCRDKMAEIPEDEEDDEDDYSESFIQEDATDYQANALRGARWLFQRAEGEEIDDNDSIESVDEEDIDEEEEGEEEEDQKPTAEQITAKLIQHGVTMEDLVKSLLLDNHPEYQAETSFELGANILFGKIRRIITSHRVSIPDLQEEEEEDQEEIQVPV